MQAGDGGDEALNCSTPLNQTHLLTERSLQNTTLIST